MIKGWKVVSVLFGVMVCLTLTMDHRKLRTELSLELRKKIIVKLVEGKAITPYLSGLVFLWLQLHIIFRGLGPRDWRQPPDHGCNRKHDDKSVMKNMKGGWRDERWTPRSRCVRSHHHVQANMDLMKGGNKSQKGVTGTFYPGKNVLWTDEPKLEICGSKSHQLHVRGANNKATWRTLKHGGHFIIFVSFKCFQWPLWFYFLYFLSQRNWSVCMLKMQLLVLILLQTLSSEF